MIFSPGQFGSKGDIFFFKQEVGSNVGSRPVAGVNGQHGSATLILPRQFDQHEMCFG
jgi:hypothetical protein